MNPHILNVTNGDYTKLKHMLGVSTHTPKSQWGYRNRYCAPNTGQDFLSMQRLLLAGFVERGSVGEKNTFFHATIEGCKAIGLNEKQIKNAMES